MKALITWLPAQSRRAISVLAVLAGISGTLIGVATPSFASSNSGGAFQMACDDSNNVGQAVVITETFHIVAVYDGQNPVDSAGWLSSNDPDPNHTQADSFASECGVNDTAGATDYGWRQTLSTWLGTGTTANQYGTLDTYRDILYSRQIRYPGSPSNPNTPATAPGDGDTQVGTGAPQDGSGGPAPGCGFTINAGQQAGTLTVAIDETNCSTDQIGYGNINCYNGYPFADVSIPVPSSQPPFTYQLPPGVTDCDITAFSTDVALGGGDMANANSAYQVHWNASTGFGTGKWIKR